MAKMSFFKTKEGGLTAAFAVIILAFAVILAGLNIQSEGLCLLGFILTVAAMLYSPFKVFVIDRRKKS